MAIGMNNPGQPDVRGNSNPQLKVSKQITAQVLVFTLKTKDNETGRWADRTTDALTLVKTAKPL